MRLALLVAVLLTATPPPAAAQCATPAGVYRDGVGWAQRLTDPARIWPLTNGAGQVVPGSDGTDCDGRGTFATGIVAARPDPTTTFTGMAPGATILGVRYTETTTGGGNDGPAPEAVAEAIDRAVAEGAGVVVPSRRSSPALDLAVREAVTRGAVVIAPATGDQPGVRSYPTSLPGVIGVGAQDRGGAPVQAESGDHVVIAAPGDGLVSTAAGAGGRAGHRWGIKDPAFAAAYVAGAVRPELTPARVLARLAATANRLPAGGHDPHLGWVS